ncbi:hypothetical protein PCH_Pc12g02010 [Penicillium rubens Wisconsin 54-1255]|uniref:Uncharacterized protein n=1 Tax=Penicillium rubens (strain ATCC 28089 / DSM 1075 / NRRL 1951 / Wisconsin 54-1255) TaxID=500485 RepID=B6GZE3_PENRW|nr:hypothetical protein PCH_Pc12g02010 [Penicillium rubens Wisconsin 54-1255]
MIADKIYDVNEIMKRLYNIVLYGVTEEVSKRGVKRKGRRGGVNYVHGERSCDTSEIQQSQNSLTYFCVRRRLCLYHRDFTNTPAIHLTSIIAFWLRPYAIGFHENRERNSVEPRGGYMCIKHGEASAAGLFNCGLLFNGACGMPDNTLVNS